jgi:hypothetical protein
MSLRTRLGLSFAILGGLACTLIWIAPALAGSGSQLRLERGTPGLSLSSARPLFSLDRLANGDTETRSITITNSGSQDGVYTLSAGVVGDEKLLSRLRLTIVRSAPHAGATLYSGSLGSLRSLDLGRFGPGEAQKLSFRLTFPSSGSDTGDNALQGLAAGARFSWSAVQA